MSSISVSSQNLEEKDLENLLKLEISTSPESPFLLQRDSFGRLSLQDLRLSPMKPVCIDFLSTQNSHKRQTLKNKNQVLFKALGVKSGESQSLLDLTAGWGGDALMFAEMGFRVVSLEKNPIIFLLLEDGLQRFYSSSLNDPIIRDKRIQFQFVEAELFLRQSKKQSFDIVYFDPMFSEKSKGALSSGRIQLLQSLTGFSDPLPPQELFQEACRVCKNRFIVKRPGRSRPLFEPVDHRYPGKSIFYDMYKRT